MHMHELKTKRVIVTGAAGGIGRAVVELFASRGARVLASDLHEPLFECSAVSAAVTSMKIDVTESASVSDGFARAREILGGADILINCAGALQFGSAADLEETNWRRCLDANLTSSYLAAKAIWPAFAAERSGVIVNIASVLGSVAMKDDIAYCVSKAGVIALTKCLALDGASYGIRANCVSPGYVDTAMTRTALARESEPAVALKQAIDRHPLGRFGTAEEIADAVLYLASDSARWITGVNLFVDGGYTLGSATP